MRLKEDETYICLSADGGVSGEREGVFRRDTRYLRTYHWDAGPTVNLMTACDRNILRQHLAKVGPDRGQAVALVRHLTMRADGFDDRWSIENTSAEPQQVSLRLMVDGDFRDLFAAMIRGADAPLPAVDVRATEQALTLSATAADGVETRATLAFSEAPGDLSWTWSLAPKERCSLEIAVTLDASDDRAHTAMLPGYEAWRSAFAHLTAPTGRTKALQRAIDDVRMLLFTTPHGVYPAAGMPWFVNVFGRDALITGMMLLDAQPTVLRDVLHLLAAHQGAVVDPFREEEPGKILHEMRSGELSRTGQIPFGRYYGSVDSTPLFVIALAAYVDRTGDLGLVAKLRGVWESALRWIAAHQEAEGGLLAFAASGTGLAIQSWKDSVDSMNHCDGRPAEQPLSVAEVQGYAFAALRAAAGFYRQLGESEAATGYDERAQQLGAEFHRRFWIDHLSTYAMAIDGAGAPLEVLSSDPGHLLWSGIVPEDVAPRLVETLMSESMWSGWGLRTLGKDEVRYNPVSYHNGSVWPHDTALFAWGLHRYGFTDEMRIVANALFDLADAMPDRRIPELVAGSDRTDGLPPTAYTHACYPQAWSAASLPMLAGLLLQSGEVR